MCSGRVGYENLRRKRKKEETEKRRKKETERRRKRRWVIVPRDESHIGARKERGARRSSLCVGVGGEAWIRSLRPAVGRGPGITEWRGTRSDSLDAGDGVAGLEFCSIVASRRTQRVEHVRTHARTHAVTDGLQGVLDSRQV